MNQAIRDLLSDLEAFDATPQARGDDLRHDLANLIVAHLAVKNWSQSELAKKAGMKAPVITRLIHSTSNCTFETAGRIFHALGIKVHLVQAENQAIYATEFWTLGPTKFLKTENNAKPYKAESTSSTATFSGTEG